MTTPDETAAAESEEAERQFRERSANSFLTFCQGIFIPSASGKQLFMNCMADFQREFFDAVAPSLQAIQDGRMPVARRFWTERTKKAAKDSDLAICSLWLVAFAKRPLLIQIGAGDRDQAAIVKRRINDIIYLNPWLKELVNVQTYKIYSKNGLAEIDIMAADIPGSHGETPDVLIVNELSHIRKWEFVQNLLDNADGVPMGIVLIATNAGFKGSEAGVLRKSVKESKRWFFHEWSEPAPWLLPEDLDDAKSRNSVSRFNRLFWGKWASGKGDALNEDDIDRCFKENLHPLTGPQKGWQYIAGLDLGISHDHSGLVIVGVHYENQKIRVVWHKDWAPPEGGDIDLIDVEDACLRMAKVFRVMWFGFDPHQAKLSAQRLVRKGLPMREMGFSKPQNLTDMAVCLLQVVEGGNLECYEDEEGVLRRDFGKFNIVERAGGYRLDPGMADEYGHADVGTALVICLPKAVSMLGLGVRLRPDDDIACEDDSPLTDEELDDMPHSLREIYDVYDDLEKKQKRERREKFQYPEDQF